MDACSSISGDVSFTQEIMMMASKAASNGSNSDKPRRLDPKPPQVNNDIYDEVTQHHDGKNDAPPSTLHHSWFSSPQTFRRQGGSRGGEQNAYEDGKDDDETRDALKAQIKSLMEQLSETKMRLGPAAERCAKAIAAARAAAHRRRCRGKKRRKKSWWASCRPKAVETLSHEVFAEARRAGNPFERLGEGRRGGLNDSFMNRSAIKLANIDAMLNFSLTESPSFRCTETAGTGDALDERKDKAAASSSSPSFASCFRFVDLCGAPGGFSEYLLWRCASTKSKKASSGPVDNCYGYGMSLVGANEYGNGIQWKIEEFGDEAGDNGVTRVQYRLSLGSDGTGDVLRWENVTALKMMILDDAGKGGAPDGANSRSGGLINLVVADGGVDAQRDADNQEDITQKIVVSQIAAALELLQHGGAFAIKMFGFQMDSVREALEELASVFNAVVAIKPVSSRPASAERYVVFTGFAGAPSGWNACLWRDRILQQRCTGATRASESSNKTGSAVLGTLGSGERKRLARYLDGFDRDMLSLNLKACSSILTRMERKCGGTTGGKSSDKKLTSSKEGDPTTIFSVDIDAYKKAWKLP